MSKKLFLIYGIAMFATLWNTEVPKRAFRLYDKGDIAKTVEALDKSLEKDTLNPGAYMLYAKVYIDTAFAGFNVDTAYAYTNKAIQQLPLVTDEKDISSLGSLSVDSVNLELLKDKIDSLKFLDIQALHTIDDYNAFVAKFDDAKERPEAIRLRNTIAFKNAANTNTWEAYEQFITGYPIAEEFTEARNRYLRLLYEERTADGSYQSLVSYLEDFPNSPYRAAVESGIFPFATTSNTLDALTDFLRKYPNRAYSKNLSDRAYHIYKEKYPDSYFLNDFDFGLNTDSLKNAISSESGVWLPKLEEGTISFMDDGGQTKLKTNFKTISEDCLCAPQTVDFVYGSNGEQSQVWGRNGALIYEGTFDHVSDLGYGLLNIHSADGERLIHKSGEVVIETPKEDISVLDNRFIRTRTKGLYGLESYAGIPYLGNEYVQIDTFGNYIWLEKENGIALANPDDIAAILDGKPFSFQPQFDEIEALPNGQYWVTRNEEESILNSDLSTFIPFAKHEIYDRAYGWRIQSSQGVSIIHKRYAGLDKDTFYDRVQENDKWLALEKDSSWLLLDQLGEIAPSKGYDSLAFWGENMVMLFRNDSSWAQFKTGKRILMKRAWTPKLLIPQEYISTGEKATTDFFMLSSAKDFRKIYNNTGREILSSTYKDVTALGPNMIRLQKRNAALADSTGKYLLNFIYDGIGSSNKGYVSILDKGKVGVINPEKGIKIAPFYDKLIEPYADTVLVASDGKFKGFINKDNKELTTFEFDEVKYLSDTIALTRIENEWLIYHIGLDEALMEGITNYRELDINVDDKLLLIKTASGEGIYSLSKGELVEPTYTEIKVLGTLENPIYFAMKLVAEANFYVVLYFDKNGNKLFTQSFRQDEYFRIACPSK
ncbi:WG repeat-containing protein [Roseivirga sp.]|uniref:WG repeat-containing protein n=1 Tax=Roseivirga sp. TaxID=1964215 RepID=UPI003B8EADD3